MYFLRKIVRKNERKMASVFFLNLNLGKGGLSGTLGHMDSNGHWEVSHLSIT